MRNLLIVATAILTFAASAAAQVQMPNPKEISGVPLPTTEVPAGTVSVRVIRGTFSNNLPGQAVEFSIDGRTQVVTTDGQGRAVVSDLSPGARVRAETVVDGERLVTQEIVVGSSGIQVLLVATDPEITAREEESRRLAEGPAAKGIVLLGPESRIVAQLAHDRLTIFYVLQILNNARVPVDIGGPLLFDLPRAARGAAIVDGSSPQATVNGTRVIITGPFAPGPTMVQIGYELPTAGGTARVVQRWPATLQELTVFVTQVGGIDVVSDRFTAKEEFMSEGERVILASGSTIPAGQTLEMELSGLPYHPRWPRYVALSLAGVIMALGVWGAATARPRRNGRAGA